MDMKQLEAFVNVINFKSFTIAAKKLYLTQPTISAHILSLEKELGVQLIIRTTKEFYPTKFGKILFEYANQILSLRQNAINAIKGFEVSMEAEITIGASTIPANYFLPKVLSDFSSKNPKTTFTIEKSDSFSVIKQVEQQKIEIGMVGTIINSRKCDFFSFNGDRLIIIAPNTLYYRTMFGKGYSIQRLMKEPFISRENGSGTRKEAEYLLKQVGVDMQKVNIIAEMDNNESIVHSVSQGLGISVVSDCAAEDYFQLKKILVFEMQNTKRRRKLYLVKHKFTPLSPVAEQFYNYMTKYYQNSIKSLY